MKLHLIVSSFTSSIILCLSSLSFAATVTLEWDSVTINADSTPCTDLAGYRLFQSSSSLLSRTTAQAMADSLIIKTTIAPSTTSAVVSGLAAGTTYYFRLTSFDASGNQAAFNVNSSSQNVEISTCIPSLPPDAVSPSTPTNLTAIAVSSTQINLSWTASTDNVGVTGYRLDVSLNSVFSTFVTGYNNLNLGNVTSRVIPGLSVNTTYYARLRAYDAAGNISPNSAAVSKATLPDAVSSTTVDYSYINDMARSYFLGNLVLVKAVVGGNRAILNAVLRHTDIGGAAYSFSAPMTELEAGIYGGYVDTRVLSPVSGTLNYKVEIQDNLKTIETPVANIILEKEQVTAMEVSQGVFEAADGNPVDGELKAVIPPGSAAGLIFKRLNADTLSLRAKGGEGINTTYGDKPVSVFNVSIPGQARVVFNSPASLTLTYSDLDGTDRNSDGIPDGNGTVDGTSVPERDLQLFYHNGFSWALIGGTVDPAKNTVTAQVNHFSTYGLFPANTQSLDAKEATIFDINGRKVFHAVQQGGSAIIWNCRDRNGRIVKSGVYIAKIKQNDGSRAYQTLAVVK